MAKFKRYYTGKNTGNPGKGAWRRDSQVPEDQYAKNWDRIFGKKKPPTTKE